eukprot:4597980-Prymnesium_polylepis.1
MSDRIGLRAITMQQPFAAAMVAGQGLHTRRGKATSFPASGEWVAVHCGQNDEHLKNDELLARIRERWPDCPGVEELRAQQRCLLGVARFVDGDVCAATAAQSDFFLANYDCSKPVCWKADAARACTRPIPYPKGNLQVWHLARGGFSESTGAQAILELAQGEAPPHVKEEPATSHESKAEAPKEEAAARGSKKRAGPAAVKQETSKSRRRR